MDVESTALAIGNQLRQRGQRQHGGQRKRWDDVVITYLQQRRSDLHPAPAPTTAKGQPNDFIGVKSAQDVLTGSALEPHYIDGT